jgi:hypothetical protein
MERQARYSLRAAGLGLDMRVEKNLGWQVKHGPPIADRQSRILPLQRRQIDPKRSQW